MAISVYSDTPERGEVPLRQRRPRAAAVTEFDAALTTLGIKQRSAAQWFRTSERNIRRWKSGARKTPPGVMVIVRLMMAGKIGPADVELAAGPAPARTNGRAKEEPPAPLRVAPAPEEQFASAGCPRQPLLVDPGPITTVVEQVLALTATCCRWPHGDPQHPDFHFCSAPTSEPPYCPRHRTAAFLKPRPGRGHDAHVGSATKRSMKSGIASFSYGRHGRPPTPRAPKILGDLPSTTPPSA
jgi:GcrA cell cycle regulator